MNLIHLEMIFRKYVCVYIYIYIYNYLLLVKNLSPFGGNNITPLRAALVQIMTPVDAGDCSFQR